jgi:hypothetical protein
VDGYNMQADKLRTQAKQARDEGRKDDADALDKVAAEAQKKSIESAREAERTWARASELEGAATKVTAVANANEQKARRLHNAGKRAAEMLTVLDMAARFAQEAAGAKGAVHAAQAEQVARLQVRVTPYVAILTK